MATTKAENLLPRPVSDDDYLQFSAIENPNSNDTIPSGTYFRLFDLPQELQDAIFAYAYPAQPSFKLVLKRDRARIERKRCRRQGTHELQPFNGHKVNEWLVSKAFFAAAAGAWMAAQRFNFGQNYDGSLDMFFRSTPGTFRDYGTSAQIAALALPRLGRCRELKQLEVVIDWDYVNEMGADDIISSPWDADLSDKDIEDWRRVALGEVCELRGLQALRLTAEECDDDEPPEKIQLLEVNMRRIEAAARAIVCQESEPEETAHESQQHNLSFRPLAFELLALGEPSTAFESTAANLARSKNVSSKRATDMEDEGIMDAEPRAGHWSKFAKSMSSLDSAISRPISPDAIPSNPRAVGQRLVKMSDCKPPYSKEALCLSEKVDKKSEEKLDRSGIFVLGSIVPVSPERALHVSKEVDEKSKERLGMSRIIVLEDMVPEVHEWDEEEWEKKVLDNAVLQYEASKSPRDAGTQSDPEPNKETTSRDSFARRDPGPAAKTALRHAATQTTRSLSERSHNSASDLKVAKAAPKGAPEPPVGTKVSSRHLGTTIATKLGHAAQLIFLCVSLILFTLACAPIVFLLLFMLYLIISAMLE